MAVFFIITSAGVLNLPLPSVRAILFVFKSQKLSQDASRPAGSKQLEITDGCKKGALALTLCGPQAVALPAAAPQIETEPTTVCSMFLSSWVLFCFVFCFVFFTLYLFWERVVSRGGADKG